MSSPSQSEAPQGTRRALETALIEKCWKDPEFKAAVIADPKATFERHTGQKLPESVNIFIHEEDANTLHLSIPPAPANVGELSDEELEKVAGGTDIGVGVSLIVLAAISVSFGASYAISAGKFNSGAKSNASASPW